MQIHELNTFTGTVDDNAYLAIDNGTDTSKINASDIVTPLLAPIESDMSVLEARMDSFTNLEEGSTTGDAELIDGRVGADGVTYTNIGGAIRSQVSDLKSDLNHVNDATFEKRNILNTKIHSGNNGAVTYNSDGSITVGTTDYGNTFIGGNITLHKGRYYLFGVSSGMSFVSTSESHTTAFVTNTDNSEKAFDISSDTSCYVGFRVSSNPPTAFTIYPNLGFDESLINDNSKAIESLNNSVNGIDNVVFKDSDNLFDYDSLVEDKVPNSIGTTYDSLVPLSDWFTSNYIPVTAGEKYALINDGELSSYAVFRIAGYSDGVMIYKTPSGSEGNPVTIPSGVDHIRFFTNTASLFTSKKLTSLKKYSADMNYVWHPFGTSVDVVSLPDIKTYGVYVDDTKYYHFIRFGEKTLIRLFKQEGGNNLFQFSALYEGDVSEDGVAISKTIATNGTDTVGPISILRQGVDGGGEFAGGWHTVTVGGVSYPTAKQESLDIKVNGKSIVGVNGLHYGECVATAVNSLYFPQTITGADLSTATKAIEETVVYRLNEKMSARVSHKYVANTRVSLYYGLQAIRIGFNSIVLPNNETSFAFADMLANVVLDKAESLISIRNTDWIYDISIKDFGLAKYTHNEGNGSHKYGSLPKDTQKIYWVLMEGTYDYTYITSGKTLSWEGVWNIYPN